jgi:predicted cytidylate kinase
MSVEAFHCAISGELASGKTSIARLVAERTGRELIGGGDIHRQFAESRGLSTLELNLLAEREPEVDAKIDGELATIGQRDTPTVFDARLGWHFVPEAFKVHLVVDAEVAAERLFSGRVSTVEKYDDPLDAANGARTRQASERRRFLEKYDVDIWRLSNYDLVVDTTTASVETVVALICDRLAAPRTQRQLFVSPSRVVPTGSAVRELAAAEGDETPPPKPELGYVRPFFFVVTGHAAVSAALHAGAALLEVDLRGEADDEIVGGISAVDYLRREADLSWLHDWEAAHGFTFREYPELDAWRKSAVS